MTTHSFRRGKEWVIVMKYILWFVSSESLLPRRKDLSRISSNLVKVHFFQSLPCGELLLSKSGKNAEKHLWTLHLRDSEDWDLIVRLQNTSSHMYLTNRETSLKYNNSGLQEKKLPFSEVYLRRPRIDRRD